MTEVPATGRSRFESELTTSLYFNRMNIKTDESKWEDRDRLILSKGHASMNLYTILANRGFFPTEELATFRKWTPGFKGIRA